MNEWNIQSRAHACQSCHRPFVDKETYHTLLFDAREQYQRLDVCADCWAGQFAQGATDRKGFVSYWHGVYESPPPPPPEPIRKENAESLLRKLIERNDPAHGAAIYILAVMLERKRLLKIKEQIHQDQRRIFIYEQPKTGDIFTVTDPQLQLDQLDNVQRDVALLLEGGLAPPAPAEDSLPAGGPAAESTGGSSVDAERAAVDEPAMP